MRKLNFFAVLIFIVALFLGAYLSFSPKEKHRATLKKKVCVNPEALPEIPSPDTPMVSSPQLKEY